MGRLLDALNSANDISPTVMRTRPRSESSSNCTMTSGTLRLTYFNAAYTMTVTSLVSYTSTTAAGATPTLVRLGLWTVAANGDLALVASTANDTTLYASTLTRYAKDLSTPYQIVRGTRYAAGVLVVTGAAAPVIAGGGGTPTSSITSAPKQFAAFAGQTDLPSAVTNAQAGATGSFPFVELI